MMSCIKRVLAIAAITASVTSAARADQSTRVIQYHPFEQPMISCAAGMLCEITLAPGEHVTNVWNAQAQLWGSTGSVGISGATPVITLKPETSGLSANLIVTTDHGRDYHIMLQSYNGQKERRPLYTRFAYDDEARLRDRQRARLVTAAPTPLPISIQMDAACAKMPADEVYGIDRKPSELYPQGTRVRNQRSVCHTVDATFIQMPVTATEPTDLPTIVEDVADGSRIVNYTYDAPSRIFRIDGVGAEYALVTGSGKHERRLRIQRHIGTKDARHHVPGKRR
jgi:type IV secretory pathway VirB9-like protein